MQDDKATIEIQRIYATINFGPSNIISNSDRGLGICHGLAYHPAIGKVFVISEVSTGSWQSELIATPPEGITRSGFAGEPDTFSHHDVRLFRDRNNQLYRRGPDVQLDGAALKLMASTTTGTWHLLDEKLFKQMEEISPEDLINHATKNTGKLL